jgi:hypothetical protein
MKVSVCLQITVDGEVVTDPDMTLGYFFFSQQAYYCYILPNLELHSIVSFGSVFIVSKKFINLINKYDRYVS